MQPAPLKTFIIYAHEDRPTVTAVRGQLKFFERNRTLEIWDDGEILAGQDWDKSIKLKLESAQLILLFISVDFINSDYIEKTELQAALQRHRDGKAKLIPIIVRRCFWEEYFELGKFQALPPKGKPIFSYDLHAIDEAYHAVALGIKEAAIEMQQKLAAAEQARQAEIEREKRQKAEAEKQKQKNERLQKQDEIAWTVAVTAIAKAKTAREKMDALEVYLDEPHHQLHRIEAETQIEQIQAAETARKIEAKRQEPQRQEAEQERKKQKATRLAELQKQKEAEKRLPDMVLVRGGTFQMGSNDYYFTKPIHNVTLRDFEIGKYLVTQKFWQEIIGNNPTHFKGCGDCPMENVSWDDVQEFLQKLNQKYPDKNYRLPSESEWEYAARGGNKSKGYTYAGSDDIGEVAWYRGNSGIETHPVGSKKSNELGIYDMSGNVWEWCQDHWHDNYQSAPSDGSAWIGGGNEKRRVLRGGSWNNYSDFCRSAYRNMNNTSNRYKHIGFRLARH